MKTIPYRPSNGDESMWFQERHCMRCVHDQAFQLSENGLDSCRIIAASQMLGISDPQYPKEFIRDDVPWAALGGGNPRCTAFERVDDGSGYVEDERQMELELVC